MKIKKRNRIPNAAHSIKAIAAIMCFLLFIFHISYAQGTWTQKTDFGGTARFKAVAFSIGTKGYICTGAEGSGSWGSIRHKDLWEYNPSTDSWTQKADFGGTARAEAVGFSIGTKGYIGTGYSSSTTYKDFWEFAPDSNKWTQKADFGGDARADAVGFSIGNKGYIGTGSGYSVNKDFWEYDPALDKWTKKADFPFEVYEAIGFSIPSIGKGYIGTGTAGSPPFRSHFYEYDPALDTWTKKADFGGGERRGAVGFSIGTEGYIGAGVSSSITHYQDLWAYDPSTDKWTQKADFGGMKRVGAVGFSIGGKGYVSTGANSYFANHSYTKDLWEFNLCKFTTTISKDTTVCKGQQVQLTAGGGMYYKWRKGSDTTTAGTTVSITVTPDSTSTYSVAISDSICTVNRSVKVIVNSTTIANAGTDKTICVSNPVTIGSSAVSGNTYSWTSSPAGYSSTNANPTVNPSTSTTYILKVTNSCGTATDNVIITTTTKATVDAGVDTTICANSSTSLTATGADSYSWNNGAGNTASVTVNPANTTTYIVTGTSSCGTATDSVIITTTKATVDAGVDKTICAGSNITLTASGANSYSWNNGAGNTASVTVNPSNTTTYIVTGTSSCGTATDSVIITTTNIAIVHAGIDTTICAGSSTTLTASGANSYSWNNGAGNTANVTVNPANTTTYIVTGTSKCGIATDSVMVSVNQLPTTPVITQNGNVLTSGSSTGNQWYRNDTLIVGATASTYTATANGNYTVVVTNTNGCSSASAVHLINTGIPQEEEKMNGFSIFPNPSEGTIVVSFSALKTDDYTIEIINAIGQTIYNKQLNLQNGSHSQSLDLTEFGKGIYLISLKNSDNRIIKKIVIE